MVRFHRSSVLTTLLLLAALLVLSGCSLPFLGGAAGPEPTEEARVLVPTFTPTAEGAAPAALQLSPRRRLPKRWLPPLTQRQSNLRSRRLNPHPSRPSRRKASPPLRRSPNRSPLPRLKRALNSLWTSIWSTCVKDRAQPMVW